MPGLPEQIQQIQSAGFTDYFHVRSFDEGESSGNTSSASWTLRTPSFELPSIPPFARITYRWEIRDQDGNRYTTEDTTIEFADSTHDWQEINGANVRLLGTIWMTMKSKIFSTSPTTHTLGWRNTLASNRTYNL